MRLLNSLKTTPLWLVVPSIALAGTIGAVVNNYTPLVFDPSLYETPQANAAELKTVDAEALEKKNKKEVDVKTKGIDTPAALADGTWTGYAACGEGNDDGWKPYYVAVTITVEGGEVVSIDKIEGTSTSNSGAALSWDAAENQSYLDWGISGRNSDAGVKSQIEADYNLSGVDTVSGATYSSVAIYNAYADALSKAAAAAGNETSHAKAAKVSTKGKSSTGKKTETAEKVGKLADGTWTGYAACGQGNEDDWKPYYVAVTLTVKDGKVTKVTKIEGTSKGDKGSAALNWDEAENQVYLTYAIDGRTRGGKEYAGVKTQIDAATAKGKTATSIDTVSGATYSSKAIFEAYYAALKKSAAAAGSSIDDGKANVDPGKDDSGNNDGGKDDSGKDDGSDLGPTGGVTVPDGTYTGHAFCEDQDNPNAYSPYYVMVEIEASGGTITSVSNVYGDAEGLIDLNFIYDAGENGYYLNRAINGFGLRTKGVVKQIQAKLDEGKEVTGINTISGATWSSKAIIEGWDMALQSAIDAAGGSSEDEGTPTEGEGAGDEENAGSSSQAGE